jgi:CubicO group peptidase (beta-lactamase class C family)
MKKLQPAIESLLNRLVAEGEERGLQVAVYHRGELVVDASAGVADPATGRCVDGTTLFPVFSTTKGITATLIHLLVERGQVAYETPIADVWPEFAAHGKETITLRHALDHTAGLAHMPAGIGHAELCDWETMCRAIANLKPVAPPGGPMVYHAMTYGWILGEVARRVDGRSFSRLLQDEINVPLGLEGELFVGIPDEAEPRVALLEASTAPFVQEPMPNDATLLAIPMLVQPLHAWMNRSDARRSCSPASNGIMTARAIARHYAALLPGGVDGVELLPPSRVRLATEPEQKEPTQGEPPRNQRLGYTVAYPFSPRAFGHNGYGGSVGCADPIHHLAIGFTRNRFASIKSWPQILEILKSAVLSS